MTNLSVHHLAAEYEQQWTRKPAQ